MARAGAGGWRLRADRARQRFETLAERSRLLAVLVEVGRRDHQIGGTLLAAALAFRIFIWLLPCTLLLSAVIGFTPPGDGSAGDVAQRAGLSPLLSSLLEQVAGQARGARYITALIGLALLAVAGATLARALDGVRVRAWGPYGRRGVRPALLRTAAYTGLLLVVILANAGFGILRAATATPDVVLSAAGLAVFVVIGVLLLGPDLPHWRAAVPGAVLFAVGVELLRLVSTYYLPDRFDRATQLYGALGLAATVLIWLTLLARLVVFGHVLNAVLWGRGHATAVTDVAGPAA